MNTKMFGVIALLIVTASLVGTGGYAVLIYSQEGAFAKQKTNVTPSMFPDFPRLPEIKKAPDVDKELESVLEANIGMLGQLRTPRSRETGGINLAMIGYSNTSIRSQDAVDLAPPEDFGSRIISMAYVAGKDKFAVIDGKLYREGEEFQEGARIRTITPEKVLIAGREIRQWVEVFNPVEVAAVEPVQEDPLLADAKLKQEQQNISAKGPGSPKNGAFGVNFDSLGGNVNQAGQTMETLKSLTDMINTLKQ
ncbi:hypothetical protein [Magnetofaba australis]|uniref:Uncharacterized protein n=1 Tax=Magnetofaba australis IT-1 TaxID=1434232 RepID=A0A1Y2K591_9PROT|nr:hypothetical protein [Magnetofaba australis]OSM04406.1 hypothetical protein MAIT1_04316 [Magnetofaba australis IT-1]